MENNNFNTNSEPQNAQENQTAEDLKFVRSVVEKTYRPVKPETHNTITWGLICMAAYISIHFLIKFQLYNWISPLYISLMGVGLFCSLATVYIVVKRHKKEGFAPLLFKQVAYLWMIVMFPIIFWDRMGLFDKIFCGSGFVYAMGLSIALGITGILHSKVWLLGSIFILTGMLIAFIVKDYAFIILGIVTGIGLIVPAIIVQKIYHKKERNHE